MFTPSINDILSIFHEVKSTDEARAKVFLETNDLYKKIEKIKGDIKTLISIDHSQPLDANFLQQSLSNFSQNQENFNLPKIETVKKDYQNQKKFDINDKENMNIMGYTNSPEFVNHNHFSSSPEINMKQKSNFIELAQEGVKKPLLMINGSIASEYKTENGKYEITFEKSPLNEKSVNDKSIFPESLVSSKCFQRKDAIRDSNSMDYGRIYSVNQSENNQGLFTFQPSDTFKNAKFQLNKREGNQSCQNDLVIHDTNSSQIIDPAYLESGGSSLQYLSDKKGLLFYYDVD